MALSFDDLGGGCDDFDAHNRRVQRVIPKPLWDAFEEEVQFHIRAGKSRYDAEKAVLERCEAAMHRESVLQERRQAQEDGTFGTVEAQPDRAPIRAALPAKVEEIPEDFGLPDKEYFNGGDIERCAARWGIGGHKSGVARYLKKFLGRPDEDLRLPIALSKAQAIEFLKTLNPTEKQSKKQSN